MYRDSNFSLETGDLIVSNSMHIISKKRPVVFERFPVDSPRILVTVCLSRNKKRERALTASTGRFTRFVRGKNRTYKVEKNIEISNI